MMPKQLLDALNEQINHEFYSSYLYLSMSAHFQSANLPGFAHWMAEQSREEYGHAVKIFKYIHERGARVVLRGIDKPPTEFKSPLETMKLVLEHEQKVTALINNLYDQAVKEKDYPTQVMLHWFIEEQVEEEKSVTEIIELLKVVGDSGAGLVLVDQKLGARKGE